MSTTARPPALPDPELPAGQPLIRDIVLWAFARLLALSLLLIPIINESIPTDVALFADWAKELSTGQLPRGDAWQYPPGVALILGVIGVFGLGAAGVIGVNLLADVAILLVLRGTRGATLWAVAPLFVGPIMLMRFDNVSTLAAVLGLTTAVVASGAWLGLGAAMKVWPGFLIGAFRWPGTPRRALVAALAYLGVVVVAILAYGSDSFLANQRGRGLQVESLAAWPFLLAKGLGQPVEIAFRSGAFEVVSPVADTVAALLPLVSIVTVGVIAVRTWRSDTDVHELAGLLIVIALLLTSRVLSPQFSVWMIGVLCVLVARRPVRRTLVIAILGYALMAQALYPYFYADIVGTWRGAGFAIQTTRLILLVAAFGLTLAQWRRELRASPASAPPGSIDSPMGVAGPPH